MAGDWIKLHRSLLDAEQMTDDWLARLWVWCLLRANFLPSVFKGQAVNPGQFITGRINASAELRVSPSKWYRGITRLAEMGCITIDANSNWTTLTICNWQTYQDREEESEQPADSQRTAGDTTSGQPVIQRADSQRTQYKNVRKKECKEGKNNTPLPPDGGNGRSSKLRGVPEHLREQCQEIYDAYPRKVGPDVAMRAIAKALGIIEFSKLLELVKQYSAARRQPGQNFKLTPHPSTWFNRGSWKEDPEQWKRLDNGDEPGFYDGFDKFMNEGGENG